MTSLESFACAAMQSMLTNQAYNNVPTATIAEDAVRMALTLQEKLSDVTAWQDKQDEPKKDCEPECPNPGHSLEPGYYWYYSTIDGGYPLQMVGSPDICYLNNDGEITVVGYDQKIIYNPNKHRLLRKVDF